MPHALIYHDLITAPPGLARPGIYWLRLYAEGRRRIAIVTEVPGNPAQNVLNACEHIVAEIERQFSVDSSHLSTYIVLPHGSAASDRRLVWRAEPNWPEASIAEIEAVIGQRLAALPPHADLLWRVIAAGGDLEDEIEEPVFEATPVDELPPPHAPWKCAFAPRFDAMKADIGTVHVSDDELLAVGERFIASLTAADIASCPYHAGDWRAIADESVRVLERSATTDRGALAGLAGSSDLSTIDLGWLVSLFQDPVVAHDRSFGNGQHRGCALRFSGASHAAVVRGFRTRRVGPGVWLYEGDG
ncbi:MAG TPA: hypothetical protein VF494_00940 [Candidatus Limnocylindrales bacterium]